MWSALMFPKQWNETKNLPCVDTCAHCECHCEDEIYLLAKTALQPFGTVQYSLYTFLSAFDFEKCDNSKFGHKIVGHGHK